MNDRLQAIIEKQEIHDVLMRYCRGVDRCDARLIDQAFHADAADEHIERSSTESIGEAIVRAVTEQATATTHLIGNLLIELHGNVADVESYFMAFQFRERDGRRYTRTRAGRYIDRFERRDGTWRIAARSVADDWHRVDEVIATSPESAGWMKGSRSMSDPVFVATMRERKPR